VPGAADADARDARGLAAELAARVNGILEPRMRLAAVVDALTSPPPERSARLLAELVGRARDAAAGHRAALDAALLVIADGARLGYERRAELYRAARLADLPEVAMLLFEAAPPARGVESILRRLDDERPLVPSGRPLTLGERKALARGHRRELLVQLLADPHPDVVAILLDNPHLTESDVLRVAARRPILGAALEAIFRSDRWRARLRVRRALALNPFSPLPLAARAMATLGDPDLDAAAVDGTLSEPLRRHAAALRARRRETLGLRRGTSDEDHCRTDAPPRP
jgi:hypothetical protein